MTHTVLLVEDDPVQRKLLTGIVAQRLGFATVEASSGEDALARLETGGISLALVDYRMPGGMDGLALLAHIARRHPGLPVIMLTSSSDVDVVVKAMKEGACDFMTKPPEPERLRISIQNALRISALEKEVTRLRRKDEDAVLFEDIVGHDGGLAGIVTTARKAAVSDIPVLITGETGTGKEIFARALHGESRRAGKPFIAVNCGAIPGNLVESTLFGHEKGAFTGAVAKAPGCFREAEGGTLFLDEVGELPPEAQVKLLRVLQQKEVQPVGSAKSLPVNVRVVSATNRDLRQDVKEGRFREDLYFRLNVLSLHLPPLRDRRMDIAQLVEHFIEKHTAREGVPPKGISQEALDILSSRPWPGNVREVENTLHRILVMSEGDVLTAEDCLTPGQHAMEQPGASPGLSAAQGAPSVLDSAGRLKPLAEIEDEIMRFALACSGKNVSAAAKMLGVARSTFYKKMGH
jgi:DNA-binding NtrC family response regulator